MLSFCSVGRESQRVCSAVCQENEKQNGFPLFGAEQPPTLWFLVGSCGLLEGDLYLYGFSVNGCVVVVPGEVSV